MQINTEDLQKIVYEAIKEKVGYAINYSELHPIIQSVVEDRSEEIKLLTNETLDLVFKDSEMRKILKQEFKHKIAKTMVAKLEGSVEQAVNKFRQDPILNAKMIMAIETIINEEKQNEK